MARRTVRMRIVGRVQGVGYRDWLIHEARARRLDGWVRNRVDGSVEALISGEPDAVKTMIAACHGGPPVARVFEVQSESDEEIPPPGFARHPSA